MNLNGLEKYFEIINGELVDFNQVTKNSWSPLILALRHNKDQNLNLNNEQLDYLIKNSDLKQVNYTKRSALIFALRYNKEENLKLTYEQFDYLIQHSDLKQIDNNDMSPLMYALEYNTPQNINLTTKQWKSLINNSDLSLVTDEKQLITLKKIQSKLLNDDILCKIDMKEKNNKRNKI